MVVQTIPDKSIKSMRNETVLLVLETTFFSICFAFYYPQSFFYQMLTAEGAGSFVAVLSCWAALCKGPVFNFVSGIN